MGALTTPAATRAGEDTGAMRYSLYRGTLDALSGGGYDHVPVAGACDLGTGEAVVTLRPGNAYFLVTARAGSAERSCGRDFAGVERGPGVAACP